MASKRPAGGTWVPRELIESHALLLATAEIMLRRFGPFPGFGRRDSYGRLLDRAIDAGTAAVNMQKRCLTETITDHEKLTKAERKIDDTLRSVLEGWAKEERRREKEEKSPEWTGEITRNRTCPGEDDPLTPEGLLEELIEDRRRMEEKRRGHQAEIAERQAEHPADGPLF